MKSLRTIVLLCLIALLSPTLTFAGGMLITGISPHGGPAGSIVSVSGAGLGVTTSATWHGAPLTIVTTSDNVVRCIIPPGAGKDAITLSGAGLTAVSPDSFSETSNKIFYVDNIDSATTERIAIGDVDGDGLGDAVQSIVFDYHGIQARCIVSNLSSNSGTPRSPVITTIGEADSIPAEISPISITMSGATRSGLVVLSHIPGTGVPGTPHEWSLDILLPDPETPGGFTQGGRYKFFAVATDAQPAGRLVVGDVNGDGAPDIVCAAGGASDDSIVVILSKNDGSGGFAPGIAIDEPGVHITGLCLASSSLPPTHLDILVATQNGIDLFSNSGDGVNYTRFPGKYLVPGTSRLLSADVNGDGIPDVLCLSKSSGTITVTVRDAFGNSASSAVYSTPTSLANELAVGDFNGDNVPDIAIDEPGVQRSISLLSYDDGGSSGVAGFKKTVVHEDCDDGNEVAFAFGDVDGDGIADCGVGACQDAIRILPKITSFTPISGPAGSVITITGKDLDRATSVSLDGVACAILSQSSSSISFNAKSSGHATEKIEIATETIERARILQSFSPMPSTTLALPHLDNSVVKQVLAADVDGDGHDDAIDVIEYRDADDGPGHMRHRAGATRLSSAGQVKLVTVRLGDADSSSDPITVAAGDVTGDGRADLVVFNRGPRQTTSLDGSFSITESRCSISILKSDSTNPGSFERQDQWPKASGITAADIQIVDLNHDGLNDLVFACSDGTIDSIFVWYNNPSHPGTFTEYKVQSGFIYAAQAPSGSPKLAPSSLPGIPGATIAFNADHGIIVLSRSNNTDPFAPTGQYNPGTRYAWVSIGDFDGDGTPDLACIQSDSSYIDIIKGTALGFGSTRTTTRCEGCGNPWLGSISAAAMRDLDNDGIMDLVVCPPGSPHAYTLFKGEVTGIEAINVDEDCDGGEERLVATGDVTGDGYADVVVSSCKSTTIYPPLVGTMLPFSGPLGTDIGITGRNLQSVSSVRYVDNALGVTHPDANSLVAATINTKVSKAGDTMSGLLILSNGSGSMQFAAGPFDLTPNKLVALPNVDSSKQRDVFLADVNGDGHPDAIECIVSATLDGPALLVTTSLGNGDGTFQAPASVVLSPRLRIGAAPSAARVHVAAGDVDGDGRADLVVTSNLADSSHDELEVFTAPTGPGVFDPTKWALRSKKGLNAVNVKLAFADMDADGFDDIVLACPNGGSAGTPPGPDSIVVYLTHKADSGSVGPIKWMAPEALRKIHGIHRGNGQSSRLYAMGDSSVYEYDSTGTAIAHAGNGHHIDDFAVADVDGDGLMDIATHSLDSGSVTVYLKTYDPVKQYQVGDATIYNQSLHSGGGMVPCDLDGDGFSEILFCPRDGGPLSVIRSKSKHQGDYVPAHNFKLEIDGVVPAGSITVAAGDVNGDGYADIVVSPCGGNPPVIASLTASVSVVEFGQVIVGDSATATFELRNRGSVSATNVIYIIGGLDAHGISILNVPPSTLPAGGTYQFSLRFKPGKSFGPFVDTLRITCAETNFAILLTGGSNDTASFRSFSVDSIITSVNEAGKPMVSVKPKPSTVHFTVRLTAPSDSLDGVVVTFGQPLDPVRAKSITLSHSGYLLDCNDAPVDGAGKVHRVGFTPTSQGDVVQFSAWGTKGALMKVASYFWTKGGVMQGKKLSKGAVLASNVLGLPMPNRINAFESMFSKSGFSSTGGPFVIGEVRSDSSKQYAWLAAKTSKDVLKSFFEKGDVPTQNQFKPFDTFTGGKPIVKAQSSLPVSKFDSRLLVELIALKINIAASDAGVTPHGFGDLVFDDTTTNDLNGYSLRSISTIGDSMMMGHYDANLRSRINELEARLTNLGMVVRRINQAFEGPLDTVHFSSGLQWTATAPVSSVSYVHRTEDGSSRPVAANRGSVYVPVKFALNQNYPNPFNPTTTISYSLAKASLVSIRVYNMLGQEIATLADKVGMDEGEHEVRFDAGRLASGVYFYRLTAQPVAEEGGIPGPVFTKVGKMMLLK